VRTAHQRSARGPDDVCSRHRREIVREFVCQRVYELLRTERTARQTAVLENATLK
jgi:hypothetical protein